MPPSIGAWLPPIIHGHNREMPLVVAVVLAVLLEPV